MTENISFENSDKRMRLLAFLNLVFAVAQAFAPSLSAITGIGTPIGDKPEFDTLVTPADYAFVIWAFIFPAAIAYGFFQLLPANAENRLLRRIRGYTLFAFAACALWSIAAQYLWLWLTVVLMIGILSGLVGAFAQVIKHNQLSASEYYFVAVPISVYAGWITVATVANTASWLKSAGLSDFILTDETWAISMLVVAGAVASLVTLKSRGNLPYALTIVWGLIGVIAANLTTNPTIAAVAGIMSVLIGVSLIQARARNV